MLARTLLHVKPDAIHLNRECVGLTQTPNYGASFSPTRSRSKKELRAAEQKRADLARARRRWMREQGMFDPARLVAEEFDPLTGRMLGNFPQAYCHVGIINCALNLSRQKGPAGGRSEPSEREASTEALSFNGVAKA